MPFKPLRLLIAYDPALGLCRTVVPRMKEMLEERAFEVDVLEIGDGAVDLAPYKGVIVGTPVPGVRASEPTEKVQRFLAEAEDLDEKKVALFCVYGLRPGRVLDRMKGLAIERGAEVVVAHPYARLKPHEMEHLLPAECMIRIR